MQPTILPNMDFNSGEFGPTEEEEQQADAIIDTVARSLVQPIITQEESTDESYMSEVDARLEIAKYFKILAHMVFDDEAREARIVENELKAWVRSRLQVLLSIDKPLPIINEVKLPFDENEVKSLKGLATLGEVEISILKNIISRVTNSIGKESPNTTAPPKPTPTLKITKPVNKAPAQQSAPEQVKRGPGRPPKEETKVVDPVSGEERVLKTVKKQRPPGMTPMPSGPGGMFMATMVKSQAAAAINEQKALNRDDTHVS